MEVLFDLVRTGTLAELEAALEQGLDPNVRIDDHSPFLLAAARNDVEKMKCLVRYGADIESRNRVGATALHIATDLAKYAAMHAAVELGVPIEAHNTAGGVALGIAAENGDLIALKILLELGAEVDKENFHRNTALRFAITKNATMCAEELVRAGANIDYSMHDGFTPLHWCVQFESLSCAELLLRHGADLEIKNDFGYTPLHLAVRMDRYELIRLFLFSGADVNSLNNRHETALFQCREFTKTLPLLLDFGIDFTVLDIDESIAPAAAQIMPLIRIIEERFPRGLTQEQYNITCSELIPVTIPVGLILRHSIITNNFDLFCIARKHTSLSVIKALSNVIPGGTIFFNRIIGQQQRQHEIIL